MIGWCTPRSTLPAGPLRVRSPTASAAPYGCQRGGWPMDITGCGTPRAGAASCAPAADTERASALTSSVARVTRDCAFMRPCIAEAVPRLSRLLRGGHRAALDPIPAGEEAGE